MGGRFLLKSETGQWPMHLKEEEEKEEKEEKEKGEKGEKKKKKKKKKKKTAGQPHEAPDAIGRADIYVPQKANCVVHKTSL
jgi:hypothetical protein